MSTETLTEWLLRQVADDERAATTITSCSEAHQFTATGPPGVSTACAVAHYRVDPRVLAECEAKRGAIEAAWDDQVRIEGEWGTGQSREQMSRKGDNPPVVQWLALPYADRPGYLAEWAPR